MDQPTQVVNVDVTVDPMPDQHRRGHVLPPPRPDRRPRLPARAAAEPPQFTAPTQQFSRHPETDPSPAGVNKLPAYLAAAIAALGFLVYLGELRSPQFTAGTEFFITPFRIDLAVVASVLAALIAGVGLLPKQKARPALVGVLSLLSFLLVLSVVLTAPPTASPSTGGMYLVVAFTAIQAIVGVGALLLDAGIISAPVPPRPKYEQQQQYGQYPARTTVSSPPRDSPPTSSRLSSDRVIRPPLTVAVAIPAPVRRPAGSPPATSPSGQSGQSGPPTPPPTGFPPTYGQPPSSNTPTTQVPTQHQSPSSQSGQSPS